MLAVARCNLVFQHLEYDGGDSYANQFNGAEND
jgi:hypothetical protein